ncbi:peptide-aspartate beta-dioxygenase [Aureococcus anophagefferens]|nr:peptide-aspartate beta-dioxygenase [Aureococcus anophagefferens]
MKHALAAALMASETLASYTLIANYMPETDVVPHSEVDLDMEEISTAAGSYDWTQAEFVYSNGGGGLCSSSDITTTDTTDSCYGHTTADAKGNSVKDNGAIRTLRGFATSGASKMAEETWWNIYKNYWGDDDYADTFVLKAFDGGAWASKDDLMRAELVKKGVAYQAVWMYVLHEFEDAIKDCLSGDIYDNDATTAGDSPHAWDEGWAFYAGSIEGTDGRDVATEFDLIVDQMTIPLIQGMLKYAFKADPANTQGSCTDGDCPKEWAEGWAFAAAVLPRIHYCSSSVAEVIVDNLSVDASAPMSVNGYEYLKTQVEKTYSCLGITCAEVGEFQNTAGVYDGMDACLDNYEEISAAVDSYDWTQAEFVYSNGGGGLCSSDDITTTDTTDSCYGHTTADAKGNSIKGSGAIRTLQGFATSGASKMSDEKWWPIYSAYWGDDNYADTFVMNAISGDYASLPDNMRDQLIKKGVAYQAVWMYVMHEFEDAISDCLAGDIWDNEETSDAGDSPHAWDEGWAFLAGSIEGTDGSGSGQMLYQLAEKRCADFGTCVSGTSGEAKANLKALAYAEQGRDKILDGDCVTVQFEFDEIVKQLTVPLVQGMLKYAFKSDPANSQGSCTSGSCPKEWAEGWAFAAAVLPQVHECDHTVASMIVANLDVMNSDPMSENGFEEFKESVESVYSCMGITCADMGEFQNSAGVYAGMDACVDGSGTVTSSSSSDDDDDVDGIPVVIVIILAAVALILLLVAIVLFFQWRKTETKLYELVANGDKASNNML